MAVFYRTSRFRFSIKDFRALMEIEDKTRCIMLGRNFLGFFPRNL